MGPTQRVLPGPIKLDRLRRARILAQLAEQQAQQRQQHVTELADLHSRIIDLRTQLKIAEQTYRTAYRRATTTGLLTGPQLRTLGLPPIDARRRPKPAPAVASTTQQTASPTTDEPQQPGH